MSASAVSAMVHYQFRDGELAADRVVNRNHNEGAHNVDEHAAIIKAIAANSGYAEAVGGPGTPGMVSFVVAPKILPGVNTDIAYLQSTLAHELFHACNVFHHGDLNYSYTFITRQSDGRLLSSTSNNGGGGSVQVLTEQNTSAAYLFPVGIPVKIIVGIANDQHTGDEGCVMRYDDATGHVSKSSTAAGGAWSGSVSSTGAAVTLQTEAASLSAEDEASKYLAFAAYARLKGDMPGAGSALDTLIAHQPSMLEASKEKADLLAAGGDYAGALSLYELTLSNFLIANPKAAEPLTLLTRPIDAMAAKVAARQQTGPGPTVTSVAPGRTEPVLAPDSIVDAYGAGLATQTMSASSALSTNLGGTTVTLNDSTGAFTAAQLFYVSPTQVDYAAPASLVPGAATVTVKAGDGTVSTGSVMVANVQPAVFTLNAAGLVAGSIIRVTDAGQIAENLYSVDASNNVVPAPVDVSKDQVYLVFYATGLRRAPESQVSVSIGGVNTPVSYSGPQGSYVGFDQVNVQLPASLAGRGDVPVVLSVAGNQANMARMSFK